MKDLENIDKLFRKALADLNTEPPLAVKTALDKHLDSLPSKKPWINSGVMVGVISVVLITVGYFTFKNNQTSTLQNIPVAAKNENVAPAAKNFNGVNQDDVNDLQQSTPLVEKHEVNSQLNSKSPEKNNSVNGISSNENLSSNQNQVASSKTKSAKADDENKNTLPVTENNKSRESNKSTVAESKNPVATASFSYHTEQLCHAVRISFTNTSSFDENATYLWDLGDGSSSKSKDATHDYEQNGDYTVRLLAESKDGKSDYQTTLVHVELPASVNALFVQEPDLQNSSDATILFTDKSTNAKSWFWDFGDGKYSAEQNPSHQYDQQNTYTVTLVAKNDNGCVSVYKSDVTVYPFWIPNAFTPNGDGNNDVFFMSNGNYNYDFQSFSMTIYNRKGLTMYTTNSYSKPWNGTDLQGHPALDGTYIYLIQVTTKNGKSHTIKGNVSLIR